LKNCSPITFLIAFFANWSITLFSGTSMLIIMHPFLLSVQSTENWSIINIVFRIPSIVLETK
jgi:hypothetical protein